MGYRDNVNPRTSNQNNTSSTTSELSTAGDILIANSNGVPVALSVGLNNQTLKVLDLSYNYITVIPDEINKLKKLTSLKLGDNEIRTIPFKIGELTELERLEVFRNKITRLPSSMSKLKKLTVLDVSENNLTKFPNSILNCLELHAIDLSYNTQIDNIPQEIINLKKLNHIVVDNKFENNSEALKQLEEKNKGIQIEFKTK